MSLWTCYPPQYEARARAKYEYKAVWNSEADGIKVIRWLLDVNAKYRPGATARGRGQETKSVLVVQLLSSDVSGKQA